MFVQKNPYVVRPGDSVDVIAYRMTGDKGRWPELVMANALHKPLMRGVVGGPAPFASLSAGERLSVPAWWPDPGSVGQSGIEDIIVEIASTYGLPPNAVDPATGEILVIDPNTGMVTGPLVAAILTSWWPAHVQTEPGEPPPSTSNPASVLAAIPAAIGWAQTFGTAVLGGGQSGKPAPAPADVPNILNSIPWGQIPWDKVPWEQLPQVAQSAGIPQEDLWNLLYGATVAAGSQLPKPGQLAAFVGTTDPTKIDWTNPVFRYVPWGMLQNAPAEFLALLSDPAVQTCIRENPAAVGSRVQAMLNCKECYIGKGAAVAVKALCGQEVACAESACGAAPAPLPPAPSTKESKSSVLPVVLGVGAVALLGVLLMRK